MKSIKFAFAAFVGLLTFASTTAPVAAYRLDDFYGVGEVAAFGTTTLIAICCAAIFGFAVNIALAYLVYRDATKNNIENGVLWAVITFFFNVIGLLVYFLAIRPEAMREMGVAPTTSAAPTAAPVEVKEVKKEETKVEKTEETKA